MPRSGGQIDKLSPRGLKPRAQQATSSHLRMTWPRVVIRWLKGTFRPTTLLGHSLSGCRLSSLCDWGPGRVERRGAVKGRYP